MEPRLKQILHKSDNIVFLGGAGVSTESGIPDFRSAGGLYSKYPYSAERMLSRSYFNAHPDSFFSFYKNELTYPDAKPNDAHYALYNLERQGKLKAVVTQNVDGLHQMAGSKNVIELHGSAYRNYCIRCGAKYDLAFVMNSRSVTPHCSECGGIVRPDIVLYEEPLNDGVMERAIERVSASDTFIIGGTSLAVYPAAGLVNYFKGTCLILINTSPTPYDNRADIIIRDPISKALKSMID